MGKLGKEYEGGVWLRNAHFTQKSEGAASSFKRKTKAVVNFNKLTFEEVREGETGKRQEVWKTPASVSSHRAVLSRELEGAWKT